MAKHAHRLIRIENKVWKCTLPNCSFFVYIGQQWVIEGKHVVCWECNETFIMDRRAMLDEMPKCIDCRQGGKERIDIDDFTKHIASMKSNELKLNEFQKDEIETIEPEMTDHSPSCSAYFDASARCTCGYM